MAEINAVELWGIWNNHEGCWVTRGTLRAARAPADRARSGAEAYLAVNKTYMEDCAHHFNLDHGEELFEVRPYSNVKRAMVPVKKDIVQLWVMWDKRLECWWRTTSIKDGASFTGEPVVLLKQTKEEAEEFVRLQHYPMDRREPIPDYFEARPYIDNTEMVPVKKERQLPWTHQELRDFLGYAGTLPKMQATPHQVAQMEKHIEWTCTGEAEIDQISIQATIATDIVDDAKRFTKMKEPLRASAGLRRCLCGNLVSHHRVRDAEHVNACVYCRRVPEKPVANGGAIERLAFLLFQTDPRIRELVASVCEVETEIRITIDTAFIRAWSYETDIREECLTRARDISRLWEEK
jgi:hypothetical protein